MPRGDLRRGGELLAATAVELLAVLPNVDAEGAMLTAEAMRNRVHQIGIENHGSPIGRLTVSVGVCSVVPIAGLTQLEGLVDAADTALYRPSRPATMPRLADPIVPPSMNRHVPPNLGAHLD